MIYTVTLNPAIDRTLLLDGNLIPGDVNRATLKKVSAGGKGINCAEAAGSMGIPTAAYCIVGSDNVNEFQESTKGLSTHIRMLKRPGLTRTCIKMYGKNNLTTECNEKGDRISSKEMNNFLSMLMQDIQNEGKPEFILLSGSIPPGAESGLYADMAALFHRFGIRVMLDCDGEALEKGICAGVFLVKPNLSEFEAFCRRPLSTIEEIVEAAENAAKQYHTRILVTIGAQGMIYCDETSCYQVTVPSLTCKTTVGAGDTVLGVLAGGLARGLTMDKALQLAAAAACAKVTAEPGLFPRQSDVTPFLSQIEVVSLKSNDDTEMMEIIEEIPKSEIEQNG